MLRFERSYAAMSARSQRRFIPTRLYRVFRRDQSLPRNRREILYTAYKP